MSVSASRLLSVFDRVSQPGRLAALDAGAYSVEQLDGPLDFVYIGCSSDRELALIIATTKSSIPPAALRLVILAADFGVVARLVSGDLASEVRVSILRCEAREENLRLLFASVCSTYADHLTAAPTEAEFSSYISQWLTLFWQLSRKTSTDIAGLAGELLVILAATERDRWVDAWHADPNALYDFSFADTSSSVEVKSTRGRGRNHVVSLDQASGAQSSTCIFASVQLSFDDSGTAVGDMVRQILDSLHQESNRLKLWSVVTRTCGSALEEMLSVRLQFEAGVNSIAFYAATHIPKPIVSAPLPDGVGAVTFRSDFELAEPLVSADL